MTFVLGLADDALFETLTGYPQLNRIIGLRCYTPIAQPGTPVPYVEYQLVAGGATNTSPRDDIDVDYQIVGWSTSKTQAYQLAEHIGAALRRTTLSMPGWSNYWISQGRFIAKSEINDAQQYWGYGAVYNIRADVTP